MFKRILGCCAVICLIALTKARVTAQTVLIQEGFEDGNFAARGWYDGYGTTILTTAGPAPSGGRSGEFRYDQGNVTVSANQIARHKFAETDSIYLAYWVKYSGNWVGSGMPYHPHEFHFVTNVDNNDYLGPSMSHLTVYVEATNGYPILATQDSLNIDTARLNQDLSSVTENRAVSGCNGLQAVASAACYILVDAWANGRGWSPSEKYFTDSIGPRYKGDWHRIEMYVKLNSISGGKGIADGIAQYYYDGQLIINRSDVIFRTAQHPNMKFNQFMFLPYIGDRSPVTQTMWVDDLIVATGRPGGPVPPPPPPPPSPMPPAMVSVGFSYPANGASISGTAMIFGTAFDRDSASGAPKIEIQIDGGAFMRIILPPPSPPIPGEPVGPVSWSHSLDTRTLADGNHLLTVRATSFVTGQMQSASIQLTVANPTPPPPPAGIPGTVSNLSVSQTGTNSATLTFTQVSDGMGAPAKYSVRYSSNGSLWGGAPEVTQGTCSTPLQGTGTSGSLTCIVSGLAASTAYQFQLVAFRGTPNVDAVFGGLSNVASATTLAAVASTDINGDGSTNVTDVQMAVNQALSMAYCGGGDVNGDGACNVTDVQKVVNAALGL